MGSSQYCCCAFFRVVSLLRGEGRGERGEGRGERGEGRGERGEGRGERGEVRGERGERGELINEK